MGNFCTLYIPKAIKAKVNNAIMSLFFTENSMILFNMRLFYFMKSPLTKSLRKQKPINQKGDTYVTTKK